MSETTTTHTDPVFCSDCDTVVRMEREERTDSLKLQCLCGNTVNVRVSRVLPEGWQE